MRSRNIWLVTLACVNEESRTAGKGGLQRWTRDLAGLIASKGYRVTVLQKTSADFLVEELLPDVRVIGVRAPPGFFGNFVFSKKIRALVPITEKPIFVSQELLLGGGWDGCISVNHGVWWDADFSRWKLAVNRRIQGTILRRSSAIVCVDTNYINWLHAEIPNRSAWRERLFYVPNYAASEFRYQATRHSQELSDSRIKLLCPRRMPDKLGDVWDGRGALLFLQTLLLLRRQGMNFVAEFAGTGLANSEVLAFASRHGFADSVVCNQFELDEMPAVYANADIVVIPTASHEGTSLSAIEGMCAGRATVVTHIGGLPNIVIDGLTGFLSDLSTESLAATIWRAARVCRDERWCEGVAQHASAAFGKARWERSIWSLIRRHGGFGSEAAE